MGLNKSKYASKTRSFEFACFLFSYLCLRFVSICTCITLSLRFGLLEDVLRSLSNQVGCLPEYVPIVPFPAWHRSATVWRRTWLIWLRPLQALLLLWMRPWFPFSLLLFRHFARSFWFVLRLIYDVCWQAILLRFRERFCVKQHTGCFACLLGCLSISNQVVPDGSKIDHHLNCRKLYFIWWRFIDSFDQELWWFQWIKSGFRV